MDGLPEGVELSEEGKELYGYRQRFYNRREEYPTNNIARLALGHSVFKKGSDELKELGLWKHNKSKHFISKQR